MSKTSAACLFSVSLSSVKRYCRIAKQGASLEPRKGGGRPPKTDETVEKLLEEDVEKRPAATVSERRRFLECTTGTVLSDSTEMRLIKRLGFSRKNEFRLVGWRRHRDARTSKDHQAAASLRLQQGLRNIYLSNPHNRPTSWKMTPSDACSPSCLCSGTV